MGIDLDDFQPTTSTPVVKRQRIGDKFVGAIVRFEQRDVLKDGEPVRKPNGKARQELVVHCITMPKTTTSAGLGGVESVPEPGTPVRLILRGGGFGDWIEARRTHRNGKLQVGDVVVQNVEYAQAYSASGEPKGGKITDQAEADALPRSTSVGFYGPLTIHEPRDPEWVTAAERAYQAHKTIPLDTPATASAVTDDEPF